MGVFSYLNIKRPASFIWKAFSPSNSPSREVTPSQEEKQPSEANLSVAGSDYSQASGGTNSNELACPEEGSKRPSIDTNRDTKSLLDDVSVDSFIQTNSPGPRRRSSGSSARDGRRKKSIGFVPRWLSSGGGTAAGRDSPGAAGEDGCRSVEQGRPADLGELQGDSDRALVVQSPQGPEVTDFHEGREQSRDRLFSEPPNARRDFLASPLLEEHNVNGHQYVDHPASKDTFPVVTNSFDFSEENGNYINDSDSYFHPPAMATNIRPPSRPPPPSNGMVRPGPPMVRPMMVGTSPGPPPAMGPPPLPASPAGSRKLSLQSPLPNTANFRPPERIGEQKIQKFGDVKMRSPSPSRNMVLRNGPPDRKVSAPPTMNYSPLPFNMNGQSNGQDMQKFMGLLEHEESDFVDQVKKSKAFIASVIKGKEELGALVASHTKKISTLEGQRMDYQKRIIEAEREKRDFHEKLELEKQNGIQALNKIEKQKRDYEKLQQDSSVITQERNDAVCKLGEEMKELERLETEKKEMMAKLDELSKDQKDKKLSMDMSKHVGDLNMKLKMEIGALRGENEVLQKKNEEIHKELSDLDNQIQSAGRNLRQKDSEVQSSQTKVEQLTEEANRLRKQLDTVQDEAKKQSVVEGEIKVENAQLKSEHVAATDKVQKLQKEISRIEAEKKDNIIKIQSMHNEMKELRMTLEDFEAHKSLEIAKLESSLAMSLNSNKQVNEKVEEERRIVSELESSNSELKEQIEKFEIDLRKQNTDAKSYLETIAKKQKVEEELLETIREIKDKVERYEDEKKAIANAERMRKSSVATQEKELKKVYEEKMEKLRIQFDKAAVESKKNITKLTEENSKATSLIEELKTDLEKKQVECRGLNTKLTSMEKEFTRYKTWSKEKADEYEKTIDEFETKLGEGRRNADSWKRKHDSVQNDLETVIKEKYKLQEEIEHINEEISTLKESHNEEETQQRNDKSKIEQKLRDANHKIRTLESEQEELKKKSDNQITELSAKLTSLKNDLKKSSSEKTELIKKIEKIAGEKDSTLASEIESRDQTITEKETEITDLKKGAELRESKLQCDIDKEIEERTKVVNQLNFEIEKVKTEVSSKQNQIMKIEKEKREISINFDKTQKKLNEIESEKTKMKDVLFKLESEKKMNNFGKYEKEKMSLEIDNLTKEKQNLASRLEDLNKEKYALNEKIKDLSKLEVVKRELSNKSDDLESSVSDLKAKCKELESNNKKDKESAKSKEKSLNDQLKTVGNEKDKLQETMENLKEAVKKHKKDINKVKGELTTTKNNLEEKEKECSGLKKDDNKSKVLSDRITVLEKQKYELDKRVSDLDAEKNSLTYKVSQMEKEKLSAASKIKDLESAKDELQKSIDKSNAANSSKAKDGNKSKEEVTKLHFENQTLKKEKDDLGKSLKQIEKDLRKNIKDVKPNKVQGQLKKLADNIEKNSLIPKTSAQEPVSNGIDHEETEELKSNFDALQKDFESRTGEIEKLTSQLSRAKTDSNSAVEKLRKSESDLSQIKEKNAQLSDELLNKSRKIAGMENSTQSVSIEQKELQRQVDDLKKKLSDAQGGKVKKSVKFNSEPEVLNEPTKSVKELEDALESAYRERKEIMETCRKEVEFHRTIAAELETSIMEDFEWKLHEMEKDYYGKLKYSKETIDEQIKEACRGILKEKDDEINKLQIKLRRDMDEKLKKEKDELQKALENIKSGDKEKMLDAFKKEKESEFSAKQKKWEEKRKKYHKEIEELKKSLKEKETEMKKNSDAGKNSSDSVLIEERKRYDKMSEKFQEDHEKVREELNGEIIRLCADYDEKIEEYEKKLEKALADKVEKMLVLREEVEVEYADKMDELRTMYRQEMNNQVESAEKEKAKMQGLESSLQNSLRSKRQDYDAVKAKCDEALVQVADLERRLNNQTTEVLRLTTELESYEYEDAQ